MLVIVVAQLTVVAVVVAVVVALEAVAVETLNGNNLFSISFSETSKSELPSGSRVVWFDAVLRLFLF